MLCFRCHCKTGSSRLRRFGCRWMRRGWRMRAMWRPLSHRTRGLSVRRAARKGQQRDIARALDGHTQPTLVPRADARHAARQDLAPLLHELRQNVRALIVDEVHLLDTELADFLFSKILPLSARASAGPSWAATRSAPARAAFAPPAGSAFAPRRSTWRRRRCLLLILCHACHPFLFAPTKARTIPTVSPIRTGEFSS